MSRVSKEESDEDTRQYYLHLKRTAINDSGVITAAMQKLDPNVSELFPYISYWIPNIKKDGTQGRRGHMHHERYTPLYYCESCGMIVHGKKDAPSIYGVFYYYHICWSCYNKVMPIVRQQKKLNELKKLTNKLKRVKKNEI